MLKVIVSLTLLSGLAWADYKLEPAGEPPSDLAPAIAATLSKSGHKITGDDGKAFCELWFVAQAPQGPETGEANVTWKTVPHGSLLGVLRFPQKGSDRRGIAIEPGTYTLRFSYHPVDGAHQGVEPQRDFLILSPASIDKDPAAISAFDKLMAMSRKASGTQHPASLSMWKADGDFQPGLTLVGDQDWILYTKIGDVPVGVVVVGMNTH